MRKYYVDTIEKNQLDKEVIFIKLNDSRVRLFVLLFLLAFLNKRIVFCGSKLLKIRLRTFGGFLNTSFVSLKSKEYYYYLATSKYIYSDQTIDSFFIKREGQFLYLYGNKKLNQAQKQHFDQLKIKCDYCEKELLADSRKYFNNIKSGLDKNNKNKNKKRILIMINKRCLSLLDPFIVNYLSNLDASFKAKHEIVVFLDDDIVKSGQELLSHLKNDIILIWKKDKMLLDDCKLSQIDDYTESVKHRRQINLNDYDSFVYKDESSRLLGTNYYDEVFNFGFSSIYWLSVIYSLNTNSIHQLYLSKPITELKRYLNGVFEYTGKSFRDEEIFINRDGCKSSFDKCVSYVPKLDTNNIPKLTQGYLNDNKVLLLNHLDSGFNGTFFIDAIPFFSYEDDINYLVLDNSLTRKQWIDLVDKLGDTKVHIYDPFKILGINDIVKYPVIKKHSTLYSLIDNYKNCVCYVGADKKIIYEAEHFGKQVMFVDLDGYCSLMVDTEPESLELFDSIDDLFYRYDN